MVAMQEDSEESFNCRGGFLSEAAVSDRSGERLVLTDATAHPERIRARISSTESHHLV